MNNLLGMEKEREQEKEHDNQSEVFSSDMHVMFYLSYQRKLTYYFHAETEVTYF